MSRLKKHLNEQIDNIQRNFEILADKINEILKFSDLRDFIKLLKWKKIEQIYDSIAINLMLAIRKQCNDKKCSKDCIECIRHQFCECEMCCVNFDIESDECYHCIKHYGLTLNTKQSFRTIQEKEYNEDTKKRGYPY